MILCLSLAIKGYKMPLKDKDLWSLNPRDSSKLMVPKLLREWEKEQTKARRYVFSFLKYAVELFGSVLYNLCKDIIAFRHSKVQTAYIWKFQNIKNSFILCNIYELNDFKLITDQWFCNICLSSAIALNSCIFGLVG